MYKNAIKMPVLDHLTSVASVAVRTGLDWFLAVFSGFGPVFFCIFHIRQPVAVAVRRNRVIKPDRTGLLNTRLIWVLISLLVGEGHCAWHTAYTSSFFFSGRTTLSKSPRVRALTTARLFTPGRKHHTTWLDLLHLTVTTWKYMQGGKNSWKMGWNG